MSSQAPGGFLVDGVLSPAPSSVASSQAISSLPSPRSHPLKSGGSKESALIRYVDQQILQINRRFAKRNGEQVVGDVKGYESFKECGSAIEQLVDVVWVSGTPSLQVPYLMSLALLASTTVAGFAPAPKTTFRLLDKLDLAFASLLQGRDVDSGEALPGFEGGRGVTGTEKVRIKSLVERTRIAVVEVMAGGEYEEEEENGEGEVEMEESDIGEEAVEESAEEVSWEMQIAKVYDRTVVELGDTIGGTPIGDVSLYLCANDLGPTTTLLPILRRSKVTTPVLNANIKSAEDSLKEGVKLSEQKILCNGEEFHLTFLGHHQHMPLMMVRAGENLFKPPETSTNQANPRKTRHSKASSDGQSQADSELLESRSPPTIIERRGSSARSNAPPEYSDSPTSGQQNNRFQNGFAQAVSEMLQLRKIAQPKSNASPAPQALTLHVKMGESTFQRQRDASSPIAHDPKDIKISIYFNGEHAKSTCFAYRKSFSRAMREPNFSGTRFQYFMERPWIIVPPGQEANGSAKPTRRSNMTAKERWEQIGEALADEAEEIGLDENGNKTPTAEYLTRLSKLAIPDAVLELQGPRSSKMGILDVVISLGIGRKDPRGLGYLTQPTRLEVAKVPPHFRYRSEHRSKDLKGEANDIGPTQETRGGKAPTPGSLVDEDQDFSSLTGGSPVSNPTTMKYSRGAFGKRRMGMSSRNFGHSKNEDNSEKFQNDKHGHIKIDPNFDPSFSASTSKYATTQIARSRRQNLPSDSISSSPNTLGVDKDSPIAGISRRGVFITQGRAKFALKPRKGDNEISAVSTPRVHKEPGRVQHKEGSLMAKRFKMTAGDTPVQKLRSSRPSWLPSPSNWTEEEKRKIKNIFTVGSSPSTSSKPLQEPKPVSTLSRPTEGSLDNPKTQEQPTKPVADLNTIPSWAVGLDPQPSPSSIFTCMMNRTKNCQTPQNLSSGDQSALPAPITPNASQGVGTTSSDHLEEASLLSLLAALNLQPPPPKQPTNTSLTGSPGTLHGLGASPYHKPGAGLEQKSEFKANVLTPLLSQTPGPAQASTPTKESTLIGSPSDTSGLSAPPSSPSPGTGSGKKVTFAADVPDLTWSTTQDSPTPSVPTQVTRSPSVPTQTMRSPSVPTQAMRSPSITTPAMPPPTYPSHKREKVPHRATARKLSSTFSSTAPPISTRGNAKGSYKPVDPLGLSDGSALTYAEPGAHAKGVSIPVPPGEGNNDANDNEAGTGIGKGKGLPKSNVTTRARSLRSGGGAGASTKAEAVWDLGVVRQIGCEMPGAFDEEDILLGVRFIIAG